MTGDPVDMTIALYNRERILSAAELARRRLVLSEEDSADLKAKLKAAEDVIVAVDPSDTLSLNEAILDLRDILERALRHLEGLPRRPRRTISAIRSAIM